MSENRPVEQEPEAPSIETQSVETPEAPDPERTKSPRRTMCATVLGLEAIVLALTTPVMITLSHVATGTALWVGLGLMVAAVVVAGLLRRPWAYALGWALQIVAVALGFVVGMMFGLGIIFALLWGTADYLGRKIERERAAAFAAWDAAHPQSS